MVERLSVERYFQAAMTILGDEGPDGLTVAALCDRLDVTKGSFYHHFSSMPGFVTRFMASLTAYNDGLVDLFARERDLDLRFALTIDTASRLDHAAEAALRAWARSHPEVAATVAAIDNKRHRWAVQILMDAGVAGRDAEFYGRLLVDVLVGRQHRERPLEVSALAEAFTHIANLALAPIMDATSNV